MQERVAGGRSSGVLHAVDEWLEGCTLCRGVICPKQHSYEVTRTTVS